MLWGSACAKAGKGRQSKARPGSTRFEIIFMSLLIGILTASRKGRVVKNKKARRVFFFVKKKEAKKL
jgi:hypothetical protein